MELTEEQEKTIGEAIRIMTEAVERVIKALRELWEIIKESFLKFISSLDFNKFRKIQKARSIIMRTKKKRIVKKQLRIISKLLE